MLNFLGLLIHYTQQVVVQISVNALPMLRGQVLHLLLQSEYFNLGCLSSFLHLVQFSLLLSCIRVPFICMTSWIAYLI